MLMIIIFLSMHQTIILLIGIPSYFYGRVVKYEQIIVCCWVLFFLITLYSVLNFDVKSNYIIVLSWNGWITSYEPHCEKNGLWVDQVPHKPGCTTAEDG